MSSKVLFLILVLLSLVSCGKSPLLLKKDSSEVHGNSGLAAIKQFAISGHTVELVWLTPINTTDAGHFLLITKKNNIISDLPLDLSVILWMSSMGHGSSPVNIKRLTTGVYDISDVYFIMDGDWQIKIQLKNGNSIIEEVIFNYFL